MTTPNRQEDGGGAAGGRPMTLRECMEAEERVATPAALPLE